MLEYGEYLDKVYGCWLGKCVVGTVGAPYEGMKQLLNLEYSDKMIETMLPNDDLDLQVLWLSVLEQKGIHVTSEDLAEAFAQKNVFWPGEYAWFLRNYMRGIRPPYTAKYENDFYNEGMGCPIRAEIWGLIVPGNPALAAELCVMDGTLDHDGNSVYFEKFWAAMVAEAFEESDVNKLIECGLKFIPQESRAARLIRDTVKWCAESDDFEYIRSKLIAEYGHCDCTNSFQNIGITLMLLLKFGSDIRKLAVTACNCGFDTDCTAGNAGALIGLLWGGKRLETEANFRDSGYVLSLNYRRRSDKILDLAKETASVAVHFLNNYPGAENILKNVPDNSELKISYSPSAVKILNFYDDSAYIAPGEKLKIRFEVYSETDDENLDVIFAGGDDFVVNCPCKSVRIEKNKTAEFTAEITMKDCELVSEVNLFTVRLMRGKETVASRTFGLIGKTVYKMYGPFWENNMEISVTDTNKPYACSFEAKNGEEFADKLRFYHLNEKTDTEKDYMSVCDVLGDKVTDKKYETVGREVFALGDVFRVGELTPFRGACTIYLKRIIRMKQDKTFRLHIGHSDAYKLYINGELVSERGYAENWTPENVHLLDLKLKKGDNSLVFRVCNRNGGDKYSLTFLEHRDCPPHTVELNSVRR